MPSRSTAASGKPAVKTTAKAPAKKPGATRPAVAKTRARKTGRVSPVDRQRFVAEAAYFKAERRGFAEGGELDDWIEAEAEIDALLDSRGAG